MKKIIIGSLTIVSVFAFGFLATPKTMADKKVKENMFVRVEGATPEHPVVYLGKKYDKQAEIDVEGYAIVHYAKNAAKPTKPTTGNTCYGFLANGAKWRIAPENWVVNTANIAGIDSTFIVSNLNADIKKWESSAGKTILGSGVVTTKNLVPDETAPDGINEVMFGDVVSQNAIAVTIVWGVFGGNKTSRQLTEWDMIFDEVDFDWGIGDVNKMDFENIATHELGHAVGMGDLYTSSCDQETMYGYASDGQIIKRDLGLGDIAGISLLY
jgi:hypothetical protein